MKKLLLAISFFVSVFISLYVVSAARADTPKYTPEEETCYGQCAAYKFVWQGDYCWDTFQQVCKIGTGNSIRDNIKFIKGIADTIRKGENMETVFMAWFACKPLIEQCIAPQLAECRSTCALDQKFYAPDISVGNPYGNFYYHGVLYNDTDKTLTFKVVNNGKGYAWDIGAEASWGHTRDRDGLVSGGGRLFKETIPELIYDGARNGPPKTLGDYVTDFLIEESNFAKYLQGFKSDADNYDVPAIWYKTIPFTAPEGELTKVIFNVDPNQMITERSEGNNTFILVIDKLPTPPHYQIDKFSQRLAGGELNNFMVEFDVKNTGEESGEAFVKIYEGDYDGASTRTPVYSTSQIVVGLDKVNFSTFIDVTDFAKTTYCGRNKKYTLVIFDDKGKTDYQSFSLPLYSGSVSGRVEDLKGKKIAGATVTAGTGETATVTDMGWYHLKNIVTLGKVTLTATHPEFSKKEAQEVIFKINDINDPCAQGSLSFDNINFVLQDQEVEFMVTIKDSAGNLVNAHVIAVNPDWRFEEDVNGPSPLPGMQPGEYFFTISAPGYKTVGQTVNAVPNQQNLEFTMEKLLGRPDDSGMHLIAPKLLWKKTLGAGERIVSNMSDAKNGNLLVAYAVDNKAKNSNLFFLDLLSGRQIKVVPVPYALGYEGFVGLDTSYDGGTVGLNVDLGIKNDNERIIKVFDFSGSEFGSTTLSKGQGGRTTLIDVSPDGFYLCTGNLFNKGLHKYTRYETEGKMDYKKGSRASALCGEHFLRNDNYIDSCKEGLCEKTISNQQVRVIGDTDEGVSSTSTLFDSTMNDQTVVVRTYKKLYYFGGTSWNKELKSDNMYKSVAVSPGGMYTIVAEGNGSSSLLKLKVFGNTGGDKTPDFPYKDVKFVFANDKGLFFASVVLNRISFYQIGEYQNEYKPEETTKETGAETTSDLSRLSGDTFVPAGEVSFSTITPGLIYRAEKNLRLKYLNPAGTLSITQGSIFSKEYNHKPVLLKGQLTAEFSSPMTVYAIKFDRYDLPLFQSKLAQFIAGTLDESEYFIVKNIHTKFVVKNEAKNISVAVESGEVKVTSDKVSENVTAGKKITIDDKDTVKKSSYFGGKINSIIGGVVILVLSVVLFIYRKTKVGGKIIEILKALAVFLWKILSSLFKLILSFIGKLFRNKKGT